MVVQLEPEADVGAVEASMRGLGQWTTRLVDAHGARGLRVASHSARVDVEVLRAVQGVRGVWAPADPRPLLEAQAGQPGPFGRLVAGPCAVESEAAVFAAARLAAEAGASHLRGGAYKPRTSPYSFDGHGARALDWLRAAADAHGLRVVTEVLDPADAQRVAARSEVLQIGSRNMQNYALLRAVGATGRPTLLKRGAAATVEEWLFAAEHLLAAGGGVVTFCERGVRGFDPTTRNLLDLGAVALLSGVHGQPVLVDPSHAAGRRDLVVPLAAAALAAGARGVMVEIHAAPAQAQSDGPQALDAAGLAALCAALGGAS